MSLIFDPREGVVVERSIVDGQEVVHYDFTNARRLSEGEAGVLRDQILNAYSRGQNDTVAFLQSLYRGRTVLTSDERGPAGAVAANPHSSRAPAPAAPPESGAAGTRDLKIAWRRDPTTTTIFGRCQERIAEELRDSAMGCETGGFLFADVGYPTTEITVASGAGDRAERTSRSVNFDVDYLLDFENSIGPSWVRVGSYHSHPTSGAPYPSAPDLRALVGIFLQLERAVGDGAAATEVIATYSGPGNQWDLHAFVARRDPVSRQITIENARIEEEN